MFEPRHNILSNVRADIRKYVVSWLKHSRGSNRPVTNYIITLHNILHYYTSTSGPNEEYYDTTVIIPTMVYMGNRRSGQRRLIVKPSSQFLFRSIQLPSYPVCWASRWGAARPRPEPDSWSVLHSPTGPQLFLCKHKYSKWVELWTVVGENVLTKVFN